MQFNSFTVIKYTTNYTICQIYYYTGFYNIHFFEDIRISNGSFSEYFPFEYVRTAFNKSFQIKFFGENHKYPKYMLVGSSYADQNDTKTHQFNVWDFEKEVLVRYPTPVIGCCNLNMISPQTLIIFNPVRGHGRAANNYISSSTQISHVFLETFAYTETGCHCVKEQVMDRTRTSVRNGFESVILTYKNEQFAWVEVPIINEKITVSFVDFVDNEFSFLVLCSTMHSSMVYYALYKILPGETESRFIKNIYVARLFTTTEGTHFSQTFCLFDNNTILLQLQATTDNSKGQQLGFFIDRRTYDIAQVFSGEKVYGGRHPYFDYSFFHSPGGVVSIYMTLLLMIMNNFEDLNDDTMLEIILDKNPTSYFVRIPEEPQPIDDISNIFVSFPDFKNEVLFNDILHSYA